MKKILYALLLAAVCASSAFAGSKTRANWNYGLPVDGVINNVWLNYTDIAAASATAFKNTAISTTTLVASATTFTLAYAGYTDIITPRNIVAAYACEYATATLASTAAGTLVITGTDHRGYAATETLTLSTTSAAGSVAWSTITSMVLTTTAIVRAVDDPADYTMYIKIGSGTKIGLLNHCPAAARILKCIEAGSLSTTYSVDTTYDTIDFAADPDGSKDYQIEMAVGEK